MSNMPLRYPLPPGTKIVESLRPRKPNPCIDLEAFRQKARQATTAQSVPMTEDPPTVIIPSPESAPEAVSEPPVVEPPAELEIPPDAVESEVPPTTLDLSEFPGATPAPLTPAAARARRKAQS